MPLSSITDAVSAIDNHPHLQVLTQLAGEGEVVLSNSDLIESGPEDFAVLINRLSVEIDNTLITENGQNSPQYHTAKRLGYHLRVVSSDSFGPLCCRFAPPHNRWCMYYY